MTVARMPATPLLLLFACAHAEGSYESVGPDGKPMFSEKQPAGEQRTELPANVGDARAGRASSGVTIPRPNSPAARWASATSRVFARPRATEPRPHFSSPRLRDELAGTAADCREHGAAERHACGRGRQRGWPVAEHGVADGERERAQQADEGAIGEAAASDQQRRQRNPARRR
jgi:hypothetical protein